MQFKAFALLSALVGSVVSMPVVPSSLDTRQTASAVTDIWDFPDGTWVENLAVRSNGQILVTLLTSPDVYQVDPSKQQPATLVHSFANFRGCLGIVEKGQDIFYVVVGNSTYQTFPNTPGSFTVWKLDMTQSPAAVTEVATFPDSVLFNGITTISASSPILLIADCSAGTLWSLDTSTGATAQVSSDPLMAVVTAPGPGINGVKVRGNTLFFTNTQQQIYASVPIDASGTPTTAAIALSTGITGIDDFQLDGSGKAYVAGNNEVRAIPSGGGAASVVSSDALLAGSTSVQFGRKASDPGSLYVTTHGPIEQYQTGTFDTPSRVVRVDL